MNNVDNLLPNESLINDVWLTDIMALGLYQSDFELAAKDIYKLQYPLMQAGLLPLIGIDMYRARVYQSYNRFAEEVAAFEKYVELRDFESEAVVLYEVKEELKYIEKGSFELF